MKKVPWRRSTSYPVTGLSMDGSVLHHAQLLYYLGLFTTATYYTLTKHSQIYYPQG